MNLKRYNEIVKERYLLAKHARIPLNDTLSITPTERKLLLQYMAEEFKVQEDYVQHMKEEQE